MRRKGKNVRYIGIICLAMVVLLSAIGVGFGAWQEGVQVQGVVATGDIDPVFSRCEVLGESCSPSLASVNLEGAGNGKKLGIQLHGAYPGYYGRFQYWVKNEGTVPASYRVVAINSDAGIKVTLSDPTAVVIGGGEEQPGELTISADNIDEGKTYDFTVDLDFRQWNAID